MRYVRAAGAKDQRSLPSGDPWAYRAACAGMPLELFFGPPAEREPSKSMREAEAIAVCDRCPVRADCLDEALTHEPKNQHGVFGGMAAPDRIDERRRRQRRTGRVSQPQPAKPKPLPVKRRPLVDATGTRRRLQALATLGVGPRAVEKRIPSSVHLYLENVRNGARRMVFADVAKEVAAIYPVLVAAGPTPNGGAAVGQARKYGWSGPGAWVGLDMDDPRATPRPEEPPKGVSPALSRLTRVSAVGCARRLQAAAVAGVPLSVAVGETGLSNTLLSKVRSGRADVMRLQDAEAVLAAWPRIQASSVRSGSTLGQAALAGWLPLEAWEGVDIDDPDAQPRQTTAA